MLCGQRRVDGMVRVDLIVVVVQWRLADDAPRTGGGDFLVQAADNATRAAGGNVCMQWTADDATKAGGSVYLGGAAD